GGRWETGDAPWKRGGGMAWRASGGKAPPRREAPPEQPAPEPVVVEYAGLRRVLLEPVGCAAREQQLGSAETEGARQVRGAPVPVPGDHADGRPGEGRGQVEVGPPGDAGP